MKPVLSLLVVAVSLITTDASAVDRYEDKTDMAIEIGRARHYVYTQHVLARREHLFELQRQRRAEAAAEAAAAAEVAPTPAPAPTYGTSSSGGCLSDAQIAAYALGAGFPELVVPTMVYIAAHRNGTGESGGCPGAVNDSSGACGLWQIYPCPGPDALDPARNAALAYSKYQSSGLSPWGM
jgi:hypothetical protein